MAAGYTFRYNVRKGQRQAAEYTDAMLACATVYSDICRAKASEEMLCIFEALPVATVEIYSG